MKFQTTWEIIKSKRVQLEVIKNPKDSFINSLFSF